MAELSINIHLNASCEGRLRSLNCTHNPGDGHKEPTPSALYLPSCWEPRLMKVHSPGRYRVPSWFKGTVLASHSDPLDIICFDTQIGAMDRDEDAPTQWACLRLDL